MLCVWCQYKQPGMHSILFDGCSGMFIGETDPTHQPSFQKPWVFIQISSLDLWVMSAPQAHEAVVQEAHLFCKAVREMVAGPPESIIRSRLQTTSSGCD